MAGEPLVNFVIAGTQKGGTTALHQFLSAHPDIYVPETKELHHFDAHGYSDADAAARYEAHFGDAAGETAVGEATPSYMYWPPVMERIASYNPRMRLVLSLRDPTDRAYSHHAMNVRGGRERLPFGRAVRVEAARRWLWSTRRNPPGVHRRYSYVARGRYAEQIERIHRHFPPSQVLVLRNTDLRRDHAGTLARVCEFLGVDPGHAPPEREIHTGDYDPIEPEDRRYLQRRFAPDLRRLEDLLDWDCSDWIGDRRD